MRPASQTLAAVILLLLAACTGGDAPAPPSASTPSSTSSPGPPRSPSASATPSVEPSAPVVLPPGIPPTYGRDVEPGDLPFDELVPDGADVLGTSFPDEDSAIVTWARGDDIFRREHGLVVWRRTAVPAAPWMATYGFRAPPRAGVLGIRVDTGDVTGDGRADALVFESTGGSGTCGIWRVIAMSPEGDGPTYTKDLCDGSIQLSTRPVGIRLIESIYGPDDPHCCPSGVRTSTLEWNGTRWRVTSRDETGVQAPLAFAISPAVPSAPKTRPRHHER